MTHTYSPLDTVKAVNLQPGDLIFAEADRATGRPSVPVTVVHVERVQRPQWGDDAYQVLLAVQSVYDIQAPYTIGWMDGGTLFTRAERDA